MSETAFDLQQVAKELKDFFGSPVISYMYGNLSPGDVPGRVQLVHEVVTYLKQHESDDTIRQWFIGRAIDYAGTEVSPAEAIRQMPPGPEITDIVMSAARRLVDGVWD